METEEKTIVERLLTMRELVGCDEARQILERRRARRFMRRMRAESFRAGRAPLTHALDGTGAVCPAKASAPWMPSDTCGECEVQS